MTATHAAPIPALIDYYKRLVEDPEVNVSPFGFSQQKISFRVVVEADGQLSAIEDARHQEGNRLASTLMTVPGQAKPSGQGINPCFLWDNTQYMLGVKPDDPNPERTASAFEAFQQKHIALAGEIEDEQYQAVCRFLERWEPARIGEVPGGDLLGELSGGFGVFQVRGQPEYVHDREVVQRWWLDRIQEQTEGEGGDQFTGQSLVSGRVAALARLHEPKIKGVAGGQSAGAVLVGFNESAYTSYGKTQSYNAPVAEDEAFEYATALNHLLSEQSHRVRLGDTTAVFWSERPTVMEGLASYFLGGETAEGQEAEDSARTKQVAGFLDAVRRGVPHEGVDEPGAGFYILGLSPNAARISVRFWLAGSVGEFADRLGRYVSDLEMEGMSKDRSLPVRWLLRETAREAKDIPPQLAGELARAILEGRPYPESFFSSTLRRIRSDQSVGMVRAAILKACLIRNHGKEIPMALNPEEPSTAYQCGRLFAIFEYAQTQAIGQVNAGVTKKFYGAFAASPANVFGRLMDGFTKAHLPKLSLYLRQFVDAEVKQIFSMLEPRIPALFNPEQQALFAIGYYHEKAELPDTPRNYRITTERGDIVKSKSEALIANMLFSRSVDYEYERPFPVPGRRPLRPDFTILGETNAETILIEHLGLLDQQSYRDKWQSKLEKYQKSGVVLWPEGKGPNGRLVTFQEQSDKGLNTEEIAQTMDQIFSGNE